MTGNANKLLTNNGSTASWTAALTGLTTVSQTDLHTLTSTSNSQDPVNRILLENLQTAVANTDTGLADDLQRTPSLKLKSNYWTGSASSPRHVDVWGVANNRWMDYTIGTGDASRWMVLNNFSVAFLPDINGDFNASFGRTVGERNLSISVSYNNNRADINDTSMRIALDTGSLTFNHGGTGTATFAGAASFSSTASVTGLATFEGGLTTGSGDDITGQGSITTNSASEGVGYRTGAGGTVTQATSRTTGVTVNTTCGAITTHTASLAAGAEAAFTVTNSAVAATDTVVLSIKSGAVATPLAWVSAVASGSFNITISNLHASTAETGAIVINFAVVKAATN
jgi:hypothetical protein